MTSIVQYSDDELKDLIQRAIKNKTETTQVEFKDARGGLPGDTWRTVSSFSHKPGGGVMVFGVSENRATGELSITGGLDLAILQEKVAELFNNTMTNAGRADHRILTIDGQQILAVIVPPIPDESKPCFNKSLGLPNGACVREGSTDRTITVEEMKMFIRNSVPFKYDKQPIGELDTSILNEEKIRAFLIKSAQRVGRGTVPNEPEDQVLINLGIAARLNLLVVPTLAGSLIFNKSNPQDHVQLSRYIVRCVSYAGVNVTSPIVAKADIAGTLDKQLDDTYAFILRNIPVKAEIVNTQRVETYEYPEDAIRELVANAIIHRDYTITETYTQVKVFKDRIEITNPGNLPPGVTIENIKDAQFSRNEVIASILRDLDYLEEYGRGIDIVFNSMQRRGLLKPIFKNTINSFSVLLLGSKFKELNDRQTQIWYYILENVSVGIGTLVKLLPDVSRPTINNDLSKMVEMGLIKPVGVSINTKYELAY